MNKCFHCGKKSRNLMFVEEDEDERIYLCRKCNDEQNKSLKKRLEHTKKIFGFPSHNRTMRLLKSWTGEFEDITIDEDKSILPKWFLDKGLMNMYDFLKSKKDITDEIERLKKSANKKNRSKDGKKCDLSMLKRAKQELKQFKIEYFQASDVERLFKMLVEKEDD